MTETYRQTETDGEWGKVERWRMCEREGVCVCVCVCEREREREREKVSERGRKRESVIAKGMKPLISPTMD